MPQSDPNFTLVAPCLFVLHFVDTTILLRIGCWGYKLNDPSPTDSLFVAGHRVLVKNTQYRTKNGCQKCPAFAVANDNANA